MPFVPVALDLCSKNQLGLNCKFGKFPTMVCVLSQDRSSPTCVNASVFWELWLVVVTRRFLDECLRAYLRTRNNSQLWCISQGHGLHGHAVLDPPHASPIVFRSHAEQI